MSDIAFSVIIKNDGIDDIIFKTIMLKGDKGNSVASVEKTSTSGLVDTYTIYLTDGTVGGTFNVTNGAPVNIDDSVTASDKTWSSSKLSGMIKSIDDSDVDADKLWSSQKIDSMIAQTETIEDVAIASFSDGADDVPVSELIVDITAVQAGSGIPSPDNMREIHGFENGIVTVCGVNLFDKTTATIGGWLNANGGVNSGSNRAYSDYIPIKLNQPYYFEHVIGSNALTTCIIYDNNKTLIGVASIMGSTNSSGTLTFTSGAYIRVNTMTANLDEMQISFGSIAPLEYHAYNGNTYEFDFGQTVYGGHFDNKGNLVVTHGFVEITGSEGLYLDTAPNVVALSGIPIPISQVDTSLLEPMSNYATYSTQGTGNFNNNEFGLRITGIVYYKNTSCTTLSDFQTFFANNHLQICYKLANPITLAITSQNVATLLGNNNIFANTGKINKLVYFKTGSEAVARMIEAYMRASN